MLLKQWKAAALLAISVASHVDAGFLNFEGLAKRGNDGAANKPTNKDQFIDSLISKMTVSDLGESWMVEKRSWHCVITMW